MYHIIINPASSSGKGRKAWETAEPLFRQSGRKYEVHFSTEEHGIQDIVRELAEKAEEQWNRIGLEQAKEELLASDRFWAVWEAPVPEEGTLDLIIVGGDGSLNEALNGIQDFSRIRVGLIPVGSGNDFALDAKISRNIEETVNRILKGDHRRRLDLGQVRWWEEPENAGNAEPSEKAAEPGEEEPDETGRPEPAAAEPRTLHTRNFLISSGVGFDAQVCYDSDHSRWKKLLNKIGLGKLIYIFTAIRLILTAKRARLEVEIDTGEGSSENMTLEDCLFGVCMNHRFEGGGFQFAPEADPTDGKLDLCIPSGISRMKFFRLFPKAYSGGHVGAEGIHIVKGSRIVLRSDRPLYLHTDGEVPAVTREAEMSLLPGVLEFLD